MPDKNAKKLYMARSLEELNKFVDVKLDDDDATKICKSASHLFKSAESIRLDGDEEKSYVLYMRYIFTVLHVNQLASYKRDKKFFDNMLGKNNVDRANEWSEKLSSSLEERYQILREEEEVGKKAQQKTSSIADRSDSVPSLRDLHIDIDKSPLMPILKNTIAYLPSMDEPKGSISCSKLYDLLPEDRVSLLIMDARSSEDYAASHLKCRSCISVPSEIIKPGLSAPKLERNLPPSSMALWKTRGTVDVVVLLDWTSSLLKPPLGAEIVSLKRAIYEWDTLTVLQSEPVVLSGGYDSWLNYYPTLATNAHVQRPKLKNDLSPGAILLDFEYPDLDKAFLETPANSPEESALKRETTLTNGDTKLSTDTKSKQPSIDRTTKPKPAVLAIKTPSVESENDSEPAATISPIFKTISKDYIRPNYDRTAKPEARIFNGSIDNGDASTDAVQNYVNRDREVTDAGLQLERDRFKYEFEIRNLRLQREMEAEEGMRQELQKQEITLLEKIGMLEEEHKNIGAERDAVREENARLKSKLDRLAKQSSEQAAATREEIERIKRHEEERLKLERGVIRLRAERKSKETPKSQTTRPPETVQPLPVDKSLSYPEDVKQITRMDGDIGFEKLNDEVAREKRDSFANRGMSRSQSFPNLSQVLESEVSSSDEVSGGGAHSASESTKSSMSEFSTPLVNRSVKPSAAELTAASNRNLMPIFGGQGRALTGLRNMGNTCYMNSVIQCLSSTRELANYLITRHYKGDINRNNAYGHPGILVEEFAAIVQALYAGQYRCVTPKDLKKVVSKYQKLFEGSEQQDAQELLTFLMEYLHEDLNKADKNKARELHKDMKSLEDSNLPFEVVGRKYWEYESLLNDSIFVDLFQGQFKSTVTCCYCRKESVKFDTFSCISLPIPSGRSQCNLRDCLQLFRKEEKMTGSSKWKCPRCKELREAIKKIDIYRLPHVLLIHLKRFFYEGVWRRKLDTHVNFPLTAFDMRDHVVGPKDRPVFDLFAVTNHYGTLDGGHYTAFCKNVFYNKWFKFDDHEVTEMSATNVQSTAAYILYYTSQSPSSGLINSPLGNRQNR